uniref:Uncharacterized protein n=1 Tax=Anguilla anguilla TaxID=7936 RepID=A0A0E9UEI2_ANGAN
MLYRKWLQKTCPFFQHHRRLGVLRAWKEGEAICSINRSVLSLLRGSPPCFAMLGREWTRSRREGEGVLSLEAFSSTTYSLKLSAEAPTCHGAPPFVTDSK